MVDLSIKVVGLIYSGPGAVIYLFFYVSFVSGYEINSVLFPSSYIVPAIVPENSSLKNLCSKLDAKQ